MSAALAPLKVIAKSYQRVAVPRPALEAFEAELHRLRDGVPAVPLEETAKNLVRDFLRATLYKDYYVNVPAGRIDLAIHKGPAPADAIAVIIEVKRAANKAEMPTIGRENVKGLHELLRYYLGERDAGNLSVRHLVATNGQQWLVFDENWWEQNAWGDKDLVQAFKQEAELDKPTSRFYTVVAKEFFARVGIPPYAWFDLADSHTENDLIQLYKLLSPTHLLKLPLGNDANTLNEAFYNELLYLIGLEQVADKGKKVIKRVAEGRRQAASLLENTLSTR